MKNYFITLTILIFFCSSGIAQVNQEMFDEVLKSKNKAKEYSFTTIEDYGATTIVMNYLGSVITKNNTYQVLTYTIFYKESGDFKSSILFFDISNIFLGRYSLGNSSKVAAKIKGQKIIFDTIEDYCDKSIKNELDVSNGLPEEFRTKCDNKFGDIRLMEDEF